MQWRALICECSIRTSHPCALPMTVLLRITCISTAAPGSALRCSMTVGGTTRSRRLMAAPAQRLVAGCSCARARALRRRALSAARASAGVTERTTTDCCGAPPLLGAPGGAPPLLWCSGDDRHSVSLSRKRKRRCARVRTKSKTPRPQRSEGRARGTRRTGEAAKEICEHYDM